MQRLPTINLTNEDMEALFKTEPFAIGGESIIYKTTRDTLYKIFTDEEEALLQYPFENKIMKLLLLHNLSPALEHSVMPLGIIENSDFLFCGYEMTYDEDDQVLAGLDLPFDERFAFLGQVSSILDYYKRIGITYGDVHSRNIFRNARTKRAKFGDMDNIQIASTIFGKPIELPMDACPDELQFYWDERGKLDASADMYMFYLLVLEQMAYPNVPYNEILNEIKAGRYPQQFHSSAYPLFDTLLSPKDFNPEPILQHAKRKIYF